MPALPLVEVPRFVDAWLRLVEQGIVGPDDALTLTAHTEAQELANRIVRGYFDKGASFDVATDQLLASIKEAEVLCGPVAPMREALAKHWRFL